jgi:hypothetical protein
MSPPSQQVVSDKPQISLGVDLLRPVLLMPPVVLIDGGNSQNSSPHVRINSVPQSPIVDFPPSPAPSQHPMVEFPAEDDVFEYDEDGCVVEVRECFVLSSLKMCFLSLLLLTDLFVVNLTLNLLKNTLLYLFSS